MTVNDITITSLETITAYNIATGAHRFTLDELQNARIGNTEDKVDILGKSGRKLNSLKRSKAVTISGSNGLISSGLLEAQIGGSFESKNSTPVEWKDYLTIKSDKAATDYKAVGTLGAEIIEVYIKNNNETRGERLIQGEAAGSGTFTYDPTTKGLAFEADKYDDGTEIIVYYMRNIAADVLTNQSDVYSDKCKLYVDAFGEDTCNKVYRIQFYIPSADFNGNFDFEMGDSQTIHAFEAESMSTGCGIGRGLLWTYTVFGADAEDAADAEDDDAQSNG